MSRNSSKLNTSWILILFISIIVIALIWVYRFPIIRYISHPLPSSKQLPDQSSSTQDSSNPTSEKNILGDNFLPAAHGEVVKHTYYSLSYLEEHELSEWVAYSMDRKKLNAPNLTRYDRFEVDPSVSTKSARHNDYSGSGYTRGHMAPAGDMAFDAIAMQESFYMSNMCPQVREYNNGVWKELEENVRDWTYKSGTLYIISGPILTNHIKKIGKSSKVTVPSAFYKVLYDPDHKKGIGFIIPHKRSEERLQSYMLSIDEVEVATGIDFFPNLMSDSEESSMESKIEPLLWKVSEKRYQLRISKWNWE